jgi:hypothetical protein
LPKLAAQQATRAASTQTITAATGVINKTMAEEEREVVHGRGGELQTTAGDSTVSS